MVLPSTHSRAATRADIIVTNNPLLGLAVQSADCVPLLIVDPTTMAVCAAHAGWRGLAAGVPLAAVQALKKNFGSRGADLFVALGPSIGACCYEVGRDVRDAFAAGFSAADLERWFSDEPRRLDTNPPMPNLTADRRRITGFSTAGRRCAISSRRRACRPITSSRRICARRAIRMSSARIAATARRGPDGGGDQISAASSIAALARRSACALASRPTCSKVTRPISCASSRAFACSGCRPGCFTL